MSVSRDFIDSHPSEGRWTGCACRGARRARWPMQREPRRTTLVFGFFGAFRRLAALRPRSAPFLTRHLPASLNIASHSLGSSRLPRRVGRANRLTPVLNVKHEPERGEKTAFPQYFIAGPANRPREYLDMGNSFC